MSTSASSVKLEPRFQIQRADWDRFAHHIGAHYPLDSFTHEEKEFVRRALLRNGQCVAENILWINIFADELLEFVDEKGLFSGTQTMGDQMQKLGLATAKAIMGFFNVQHAIRLAVPVRNRTPEQQRVLEIHPNIVNFPVQLSLDIGRFLKLHKVHVGKESGMDTQEKYIFERLHNQLQEAARVLTGPQEEGGKVEGKAGMRAVSMDQQGGEQIQQQQVGATPVEWHPHGAESTFLRLCVHKVWADKYEQEQEWSPHKMINEWLQEAIQLYNHVSYHWESCSMKKFPTELFNTIRLHCANYWLHDISQRAGAAVKGTKPSTNWVTDWSTFDKRNEWEMYYCSVILTAKNIARLLGKREIIPHEELMGGVSMEVEEPAKKKKRTTDGTEGTSTEVGKHEDLEQIIRNVLHFEIQGLERRLMAVDRHGQQRHNDLLRELGGHVNPLRNQVYHVNQYVTSMYTMLDRMNQQQVGGQQQVPVR